MLLVCERGISLSHMKWDYEICLAANDTSSCCLSQYFEEYVVYDSACHNLSYKTEKLFREFFEELS